MKIPKTILAMRDELTSHEAEAADYVWQRKEHFIRWSKRKGLFMPGTARIDYYKYTAEQKRKLKDNKIRPDARGNGPAVMTFLLAGGERPMRRCGYGWPIHHIYDGEFPFPGQTVTLHAVRNEDHFTEAAGLVAIHPAADGLALEIPYFAWLLRYEAWFKFEYDPDGVFEEV